MATGTFLLIKFLAYKTPKNAHINVQKSSKNFKPSVLNVVILIQGCILPPIKGGLNFDQMFRRSISHEPIQIQ